MFFFHNCCCNRDRDECINVRPAGSCCDRQSRCSCEQAQKPCCRKCCECHKPCCRCEQAQKPCCRCEQRPMPAPYCGRDND